MHKKIWLMEGLSSQRNIIEGIKSFSEIKNTTLTVFASHRHQRNEILSLADYSLIEPQQDRQRLPFILKVVKEYGINAIHAGRNCQWFEAHRAAIEAAGVALTTGAHSEAMLTLADDKVAFAAAMQQAGLPVVPSIGVTSAAELKALLASEPFPDAQLCVKPVTGIYGMGFWRFDNQASATAHFSHPENRLVHPQQYLAAVEAAPLMTPLVVMPYLPGPEYSMDMLVERGKVLAAVARRKEGALQYLENRGEAFELGCACAEAMQADGLINVQTRNDNTGKPVLLEINMRPSGGIGYTQHSGVNLPGLFAFRQLGLMTSQQVQQAAQQHFYPAIVRALTEAISYEPVLTNRLQ